MINMIFTVLLVLAFEAALYGSFKFMRWVRKCKGASNLRRRTRLTDALNPAWPHSSSEEGLTQEQLLKIRDQEEQADRNEQDRIITLNSGLPEIEPTIPMPRVVSPRSPGVMQIKEQVSNTEVVQQLKQFVKPDKLLEEMLRRVESGELCDEEKNFIADMAAQCLLRDAEEEKDPVKKKEKLSRFEEIRQNMGKR